MFIQFYISVIILFSRTNVAKMELETAVGGARSHKLVLGT